MRSLTALLTAPLLTAALLASCGAGPATPAAGAPTTPPTTAPASLTVRLETLAVTGALNVPGTLRVNGRGPADLTVTAHTQGAPVSVTLNASGGDTLIGVTGTGAARGPVTLSVQAGAARASVTLPLLRASAAPITGGTYQAGGAVPWQGGVLLRAVANAGADARHALMGSAGAEVTALPFPVSGLDTITGHAVAPDGSVWVAVRGATAAGSELIRRAPDGTLTRVPAGTTETLSSLGVTPDGRVWAVVYGQARLLSAAPDGTRGELPLGSVPDALTVGADGALLLTRRGDSPAVLRVDPASGAVRTYPVGTPGVSVPAAPTPAPDGTLLFTETRAGGAWRLDPRSGAQVALPLPAGARAGALAAAPDGSVWVSDPSAGTLLRVADGAAAQVTLGGAARALTVTPDGRVWFELGGQLITLD
ncbi:hypothetical protein DEIGR_100518 [Deinococcus grandis]|uniref:Uncharacterized protein n=2 Tax=Deinococcus TaxID=1298 RepID=A0A124BR94_9DEIO|nr:hypothetical protein [Deinococcus grandis]BBN96027.1 hypothetical protein DEGR_27600 [Deinococcus grandis]GAQ20491.1 hypothetical protein DEIGR_100518 [Deinococcus grandis]